MSKTVAIRAGGQARIFNDVEKLHTEGATGGGAEWVPEDEASLVTKQITQNGEYSAESDGAYGFDRVYVNVNGGTTGRRASDGQQVYVDTDPTGTLTEQVVPTSIVITTPPTVTEYHAGDEIDYTGMVVTAYDALGDPFDTEDYPNGIVPIEQLILPKIVPFSLNYGKYGYIDTTPLTVATTWHGLRMARSDYGPFVNGADQGYFWLDNFAVQKQGTGYYTNKIFWWGTIKVSEYFNSRNSGYVFVSFNNNQKMVISFGTFPEWSTDSSPLTEIAPNMRAAFFPDGDCDSRPWDCPITWSRPGDGAPLAAKTQLMTHPRVITNES